MIVKNESPVIGRCIASVRPLIDHWVIIDTGSTDGTQDLIRAALRDLPGTLYERPWRDFASNRSEALALAREHGTYSLIIDADDTLDVPSGYMLPQLSADSYVVDIVDSALRYQRTQLVRNTIPWCYRGVLHEFLSGEGANEGEPLPLIMRRNHDGARRRDPETYHKDAAILKRALDTENDPFLRSRYTFYLAQSYRDCGEKDKALQFYRMRSSLGFWQDEVFVSLYEAARIKEELEHPEQEVIDAYLEAAEAAPARAEALHRASRFCRNKGRYEEGYRIAKRGLHKALQNQMLFAEPWVYDYGLLDEYAVNAFWSGHYKECEAACDQILLQPNLPDDDKERVRRNRAFAIERSKDQHTTEALDASAKTAILIPGQSPARQAKEHWKPNRPLAGTELMVEGLARRLGQELEQINLRVNAFGLDEIDERPLVIWFHHDINQQAVQWCGNRALTARVSRFVFVSYWQQERYLVRFGIPEENCVVIRHALDHEEDQRLWNAGGIYQCAYISTPFRGLDVLLDAWEKIPGGLAELNVWSSMKLYQADDAPYQQLFNRAQTMSGVHYRGLAPNTELRAALRSMHFLVYPNTFAETACLSVIEAMSAGCRVIVPSHGALPETTGGFARIYPRSADKLKHAELFSAALMEELANPWKGRSGDSLEQQSYCATIFSWKRHIEEWQGLIAALRKVVYSPQKRAEDAGVSLAQENDLSRALIRLRDSGFSPSGIVDVGAHDGAFGRAARQVFPSTRLLMVEALPEKARVLEDVAREVGNADSVIALLGDREQDDVSFFVVDTAVRPDLVKTGSSIFRENVDFPMTEFAFQQQRLETVIRDRGFPVSFIKVDVQGAELAVLRGLGPVIADVEVILIEMSLVAYNSGAPLFAEVVTQLNEWGFVLLDIVEEHRYRDGRLLQFDGMFVRAGSNMRPQPPFWSTM